jgi:hypothetical protein
MANSLLTIDMITREALRLFINSNALLRNVSRQYDDQFARTGAKIGDSLRIRLPNDYTVRTGKNAVVQDTNEQSTTLTVATQKGVDISFSSADRALSLDDYSSRVLRPAMNVLAGGVAYDLFSGLANTVPNAVWNGSGGQESGTLVAPNPATALDAGAILDEYSAPTNDRRVMLSPRTQARLVAGMAGLFNPQRIISDQFESGALSEDTLGFDWFMDQTVPVFVTPTLGTLTVNGANQTGTSLVVSATTAAIPAGTIITIAGVNRVNRVTKQDSGSPMQFVVTADAAEGATSLSIYPAIVPPVSGASVAYQTVTASPANGAAVTSVLPEGVSVRKNIAFYRDAFTLATADLELPRGVHEASRQSWGGVSLRAVTQYNVMSDDFVTRLDILYGWAAPRPEWAVVLADAA